MKTTIAVLLTCHNRREKTITCLKSLFEATLPEEFSLDVFLVDDGSIDGTSNAVLEQFPSVNIIQGSGNLYWNQGMRLAWETATETKDYEFYLWLNDDTNLDANALIELVVCSKEALKIENRPVIITGACRNTDDKKEFSYGGRTDTGPVLPNGSLQKCKFINGNAVLVSNEIYQKLGNLSPDYTHAMGDFDYGLRALKAGFSCYTTKRYIATCEIPEGFPAWCNPKTPLLKRLKLLHSPKGLNVKEYIIFRKKFEGKKYILFSIKVYLRVIFPNFYKWISN